MIVGTIVLLSMLELYNLMRRKIQVNNLQSILAILLKSTGPRLIANVNVVYVFFFYYKLILERPQIEDLRRKLV